MNGLQSMVRPHVSGVQSRANARIVVDFYNQINLLYGSITEFCSPQSCPEMKATDEFEYLWQDNEQFKKPTKMPAPEYVEHLMSWVQGHVDNEQMFPSRIGMCLFKLKTRRSGH